MNIIDSVLVNNSDIRSRAAYMLLVNKLRKMDKTTDWRTNVGFRHKFLRAFKNKHGEPFCEYCGKHPLIADDKGLTYNKGKIVKEWLATLDHIIPRSKGGARFSKDNIKLCCPKCNMKKGNLSIKEFKEYLHRNRS